MFTTKIAAIAAAVLITTTGIFASFTTPSVQNVVTPSSVGSFCVTAYNADDPSIISKHGNCSDAEEDAPVIETPPPAIEEPEEIEETGIIKSVVALTIRDIKLGGKPFRYILSNADTGEIAADESGKINQTGYVYRLRTANEKVPLSKILEPGSKYKLSLNIDGTEYTHFVSGDDFFIASNASSWTNRQINLTFTDGKFTKEVR